MMTSIRRAWLVAAVFTIPPAWTTICLGQEPERQEAVIDGVRFSLANGLQVEKVADEPLIKWPIVADWDDQGRLVVAESGGVGWPIQEHNQQGLHKIVRLVDEDRDGKFDRRIIAADNMAFPEGVLCLGEVILVSAPPVIWKLTDADQDGVCEHREVWFDGKTVTNCANDLHGPYLGRDGWIYWCKGAFGEQTHELVDGRKLQSSAAHIYRKRYDSPLIEPVISGGMDNPVEMAFIPEGEKFFTSTFLQHPSDGLRDGIAHAVYGGLFGKDHHVINGHVRTGPLMPIMTQLGPAAPSGLICLESDHLTDRLAESTSDRFLCAALFNLHKVTAHRLVRDGASFRSDDHDLLVTDRVDFHPTDVIEDADGSLLVLDTGGWYDLCCPTSRIDQTTAAGGIYRITSQRSRTRQATATAPDWASIDLAAAVPLLLDSRPWVRRRATRRLVEAGDAAVPLLQAVLSQGEGGLNERLTALWTLCQIGTERAFATAMNQINASEASLAQAACHVAAMARSDAAITRLQSSLRHPSLQVRRAAAEALGRIGSADAVESLLNALEAAPDDRHLEHSVLYALVEITRKHPETDLRELATSDKRLHAAILVMDQLDRGHELDPAQLLAAAQTDQGSLRNVSIAVLAAHPQWANAATETLETLWSRLASDPRAGELLAEVLSGWKDEAAIADRVGNWITAAPSATDEQQWFLAANLHQLSPRRLWPEWSQPLANWLEQAEPDVQSAIATSLAQLELGDEQQAALSDRVVRLASRTDSPAMRLKLLASVPLRDKIAESEIEREVVTAFVDPAGVMTDLASDALLRCRLSRPQAEQLVGALPQVPPQHLMTAIETVRRAGITELEATMLTSLADLPAARTLPRGFLINLYKNADKRLREQAATTTAALETPPENIRQAVDAMLGQLSEGDPVRGLQVFRSQRAACSGCHRMGYIGKEIGPNLTRIGQSRTAEALLEAILYPSARLEQSYQSTRVLTVDGQIYNGLLRGQDEKLVELQLNAERSVVIPREDIEQMEPSDVSVMPQGIDQVLSKQDLADLMALLQSAK